ncbi:MAG: hypothetical protein ACU843_06120 [Gammaproteobacteria bacterium]
MEQALRQFVIYLKTASYVNEQFSVPAMRTVLKQSLQFMPGIVHTNVSNRYRYEFPETDPSHAGSARLTPLDCKGHERSLWAGRFSFHRWSNAT